tara:strand:+ start:1338 stop:1511 length:174 start_codon:yes stop_codon:yes gene_type:complete
MLLAAIFQMSPMHPIPIAEKTVPCTQTEICKKAVIQLAPSHVISKEEVMEYVHSEKV